jgi:glycosyltransferase involved in cell wall biosynthesis
MNNRVTPLVSVVIPSYNHAQYLGRALQSVLDQTYVNWEAIVIDNHSTDNTDEVMASIADPRITYLKIHNNGVIAASRNAGIKVARGAWVAFLDSDDWWTKNKLQVCFDSVDEEVDLVYHELVIVSDQPRTFRRKTIKSWQVKAPVIMDLLIKGNAIVNSSVMVRKNFLEKIGGINDSREMIAAEDYNTWLRIAQFTDKFLYLPFVLGYYLQHNNNISKKNMSLPGRSAVAEFIGLLSEQQKLKLLANFKYTSGRFNCLIGNYNTANEDLWFVVKYGYVLLKVKSLLFLMRSIVIKNGCFSLIVSKLFLLATLFVLFCAVYR